MYVWLSWRRWWRPGVHRSDCCLCDKVLDKQQKFYIILYLYLCIYLILCDITSELTLCVQCSAASLYCHCHPLRWDCFSAAGQEGADIYRRIYRELTYELKSWRVNGTQILLVRVVFCFFCCVLQNMTWLSRQSTKAGQIFMLISDPLHNPTPFLAP